MSFPAARAATADMVLVSVFGATAGHPMELFRMKAAAEDNLRTSGVPWTIVRASGFLELYLDLMRRTAGGSGRPLVFGRGDGAPNSIHARRNSRKSTRARGGDTRYPWIS